MADLFVAGVVNLETSLRIESFPVAYTPVRYTPGGIRSGVSGVGYNVAKALHRLGASVCLASLVGRDPAGRFVKEVLKVDGLWTDFVADALSTTPQSVVLYDAAGQRQINTDLGGLEGAGFSDGVLREGLTDCTFALVGNADFCRSALAEARRQGIPVATDVHALADLDNPHDQDFMKAATVLFMSDVRLPTAPRAWLEEVMARFACEVAVVTRGEEGALMAVRKSGDVVPVRALRTRAVVSTVGAGDALFASFMRFYAQGNDPYEAISLATVFASYTLGEPGGAEGFLDEAALRRLHGEVVAAQGPLL